MPSQDTSEIKNKIILVLRKNGPSLPVHISRQIESSILFTSAFLSELVSEKKIKMSNMKIGNSPLYFLPGQENRLEKFSENLKSKEKEAYDLLKEKKVLKDSKQEPAIRVALRALKDFAVPFKKEGSEEIFWKFFNTPEKTSEKEKPKEEIQKKQADEPLDIFDRGSDKKGEEKSEEKKPKTKNKKKPKSKKITQKESNFFKKVKSFLSENSMELLDILSFSKKEIIVKIKKDGKDMVLIAFDKKRVNEKDIVKASKKTKEYGLPYIILIKGTPYKKTKKLLKAVRKLDSIEKF